MSNIKKIAIIIINKNVYFDSKFDKYIFYDKPIDKKHNNITYIEIINGDFNLLKYIIDIKYKYILYCNENYDICCNNLDDMIDKHINYLDNNATINQIVLSHDSKILDNYNDKYVREKIRKFNFDDSYRKFELISYIFIDKKNPHEKKYDYDIDMNMYVKGEPENFTYFRLKPSIIRVDSSINFFPLLQNHINEKKYANISMNKNNVTLYSKNNIFIENVKNNKDKKDFNNMTIVTGFIDMNAAVKKHKYSYIERSEGTLKIPQYMVVFVTKDIEDHIIETRKKYGLLDKTRIIIIEKKDLYMYDRRIEMETCAKKNQSPYNNPYYIMSVNSRYNYLKRSIEKNYFNTDYFGWVDFGLSHIVAMENNRGIHKLGYNNPYKIRIAWISRIKKSTKKIVFDHAAMCGGVYMGHKYTMLKLINLHDYEFKQMMKFGHCINDDKLLYFIYQKYPELFDMFHSGYMYALAKMSNV
jgi:hypothetical protein